MERFFIDAISAIVLITGGAVVALFVGDYLLLGMQKLTERIIVLLGFKATMMAYAKTSWLWAEWILETKDGEEHLKRLDPVTKLEIEKILATYRQLSEMRKAVEHEH